MIKIPERLQSFRAMLTISAWFDNKIEFESDSEFAFESKAKVEPAQSAAVK